MSSKAIPAHTLLAPIYLPRNQIEQAREEARSYDDFELTPMSIGLALWTWPNSEDPPFKEISTLGVDVIQVDLGKQSLTPLLDIQNNRDQLISACSTSGLVISAVTANRLNDIGISKKREWGKKCIVQETMLATIEAAINFNAKLVYFPSFRNGKIRNQSDFEQSAKSLAWACREAQPHGLTVASENSLSTVQALSLIDTVDEPNFKIVLDTFNPIRFGHCPIELVENVGAHLSNQIHVKDGCKSGGSVYNLGQGDVQLDKIFSSLKNHIPPMNRTFVIESKLGENALAELSTEISTLNSLLRDKNQHG